MLIRLLKISINLFLLPLILYLIYFYREIIINETISIIYLGDIIQAGLENLFIGNYLSFIFALTIVGIWVRKINYCKPEGFRFYILFERHLLSLF